MFPLGCVSCSEEEELFEFLVFGGYNIDYLDSSLLFRTSLSNFEASGLRQLKQDSKDVLLGANVNFDHN